MSNPDWVKSLPFDRDCAIFTVDGHKYVGKIRVRPDAIILDVKRTSATDKGESQDEPWSVVIPVGSVASVHFPRTTTQTEQFGSEAGGPPAATDSD